MRNNGTKAKLKAGETVFGCFIRNRDPGLVECLAHHNWDFFVFDAEHGTLDPRDCENLVRAAELHDVTPIIRATTNQQPIVLRYLDTGAQGIQIPWINSVADAEAAVRYTKYRPRGIRGLAGVRAADYGLTMDFGQYTQWANAETLVVVQIETAEGVEQADSIAQVEDVDVVFIGPTDLSHSLGHPGQIQHPVVREAMARVIRAVEQSPAALGIFVGSPQAALEWRDRGAAYIALGFESLLSSMVRDCLHTLGR